MMSLFKLVGTTVSSTAHRVYDQATDIISNPYESFKKVVTGTNISRHPLYRPRPVTLQLYKEGSIVNDVQLTEVTSIEQEITGQVGIMQGVVTSVVQGWYLAPVTVTISGRSYIGAYKRSQYNESFVDHDIEQLLSLRQNINDYFLTTNGDSWSPTTSRLYVQLIYGDTQAGMHSSDRGVLQQLQGFIADMRFQDDETVPYMRTYTIRFVGNTAPNAAAAAGNEDQDKDAAAREAAEGRGVQ